MKNSPHPVDSRAMHHVETFHSLQTGLPIRVACDCDMETDHLTAPRWRRHRPASLDERA